MHIREKYQLAKDEILTEDPFGMMYKRKRLSAMWLWLAVF